MSLPDLTTIPPWWEEARWPAPGELAHWLSITSDANREWWLQRVQRDADTAGRCWEHDHQGQIEYFRHALNEARLRIAWLEKHYAPVIKTPPPYRPNMTQYGEGW